MTQLQPTMAPGEPDFIRCLREGVEYTRIKMIFLDLPSALTTLLWSTQSQDDQLVTAFKGRTIRAIERALRRAETAQPDRLDAIAIRYELVSLCLHEANSPSSPHEDHRISVTHVFPQLFDEAHRPPGPSVPYVRITVSSVEPR